MWHCHGHMKPVKTLKDTEGYFPLLFLTEFVFRKQQKLQYIVTYQKFGEAKNWLSIHSRLTVAVTEGIFCKLFQYLNYFHFLMLLILTAGRETEDTFLYFVLTLRPFFQSATYR